MKRLSVHRGMGLPVVRDLGGNPRKGVGSSPDVFVRDVGRTQAVDRPSPSTPGPTTIVRLPNGREVMLPGDGDTFGEWVRRITKTGTFPEQRDALAALARCSTSVAPEEDGRPIVAIVISEPHHLSFDGEDAVRRTIDAVEARGCRPVLVPPRADLAVADPHLATTEVAGSLVARFDGLIGLGGDDVHPFLYGQPKRHAVNTNLPRDRFEAALIRAALDAEIFMLGICRSHQLWNVVTGGVLAQDVQAEGLASSTRDQRERGIPMSEPTQTVHVRRRTRLRKIIGQPSFDANGAHHQAVLRPGRAFIPSAYSTDPVLGIRMIQATESKHAITVQGHPELRAEGAPERALIDEVCRQARAALDRRLLLRSAC